MVTEKIVVETHLADLKLFFRGKVRDLYEVDNKLLIVTTDRISAFDCVLPNGIPYKGKVLTALSEYWFNLTNNIIPNHLISTDIHSFPESLKKHASVLKDRSMLVKKAERIPAECIVRGYLAGSAWKEYKEKGSVSGIGLPPALKEAERLEEPIFTPATKATSGHDINITEAKLCEMVGKETGQLLKKKSLEIYQLARDIAESRGIIISDMKMEFGFVNRQLLIIDELLTPDSSRFWPMNYYNPGGPQRSFDKQFVRDYLEKTGWDQTPPAPDLPPDVITKTSEKYLEAFKRITGKSFN